MVDARLVETGPRTAPAARAESVDLARRLPALIVAARETAASVMHGVHGRRRAGVGETFWQFRPFISGEASARVDWRRSARDDRLYVREREWEAAHVVWLWIDRSPSMGFVSDLARAAKIDRALVLGLALADLLARGGERVGLIGLTRPTAARDIVERLALAMQAEASSAGRMAEELPGGEPLGPRTRAVLISDFLNDAGGVAETVQRLSARGARGHLVTIADPVEEAFPFSGHTEFVDVDSRARLRVGHAESFRDDYLARLSAHRARIDQTARARGWSSLTHRTDRPASEALLTLRMRLEGEAR
jgi:uncharacterized protein (DUF58 family)